MNKTVMNKTVENKKIDQRENGFPVSSPLPLRIGVIQSLWHREIVDQFVDGFEAQMSASDFPYTTNRFEVPGVVEIPLFSQKLIATGRFDMLVVVGLIVDHGVYRHDFVAGSVMNAIMDLQMQSGIPVIYGILTPQDFLSEGREAFFKAHFTGKGHEAANAAQKTWVNLCSLAHAG